MNQRGHCCVCWMSTSGKNGLMWRTHTLVYSLQQYIAVLSVALLQCQRTIYLLYTLLTLVRVACRMPAALNQRSRHGGDNVMALGVVSTRLMSYDYVLIWYIPGTYLCPMRALVDLAWSLSYTYSSTRCVALCSCSVIIHRAAWCFVQQYQVYIQAQKSARFTLLIFPYYWAVSSSGRTCWCIFNVQLLHD